MLTSGRGPVQSQRRVTKLCRSCRRMQDRPTVLPVLSHSAGDVRYVSSILPLLRLRFGDDSRRETFVRDTNLYSVGVGRMEVPSTEA